MKIKIVKEKLITILDYLSVDGLFPFPILTTVKDKPNKLFSVQSNKDGFAFRYAVFLKEFFNSISKEDEAVRIDGEQVKGFVSLAKPKDEITLLYPSPVGDNQLQIIRPKKKGVFKTNIIVTKLDKEDIKTGLPFKMIKKDTESPAIPYLEKGTVPLDTHIELSIDDFKEITSYAMKHGTDYIRFRIEKGTEAKVYSKLRVIVGDIRGIENNSDLEVDSTIKSITSELDITFTRGFKELTKTFARDIDIKMRSGMPALFTEHSQSHIIRVLLTPVKEGEE